MNEVIKIDAKYLQMTNDYLNGTPIPVLANRYDISEEQASSFLNRKEVRTYIAQTLQQSGMLNPLNRVELINKMINKKIEDAEEANVSYTKRDMVELIKLMQKEQELLNKQVSDEEIVVNH